jgi:hypothetical protein
LVGNSFRLGLALLGSFHLDSEFLEIHAYTIFSHLFFASEAFDRPFRGQALQRPS